MPFRSVCGMSEHRFRHTAGGVCWLGLLVVWCLKHRCRVADGRVAARCGEGLEQVAGEHGWQIVAKEVMADHLHLLARVGPTDAPAAVVGTFKCRTARMPGAEFPYVRRLARVLWSASYLVASVGTVFESRVRRYLERQWEAVAS